MKVDKYRLKKIFIKNFKCHSELIIGLDHLNDIYGKNRTGKSSILEALKFSLSGTAKDVDKIKSGTEYCFVESEFIHPTKIDNVLVFKSHLTKKGIHTFSCEFQGKKLSQPKKIAKDLVGIGTFDPREILDKKDRDERLLQFFPSEITEQEVEHLPYMIDLDFSQGAFLVIKEIEKDLRNQRLSLYQKKDILSKAYEKTQAQLFIEIIDFEKKHNVQVAKTSQDTLKGLKETYHGLIGEREAHKNKVQNLHRQLEESKSEIDSISDQYRELQKNIEILERDKKRKEKEYNVLSSKCSKLSELYEEALEKEITNPAVIERAKHKVEVCEAQMTLKDRLNNLKKDEGERDAAISEWQVMNSVITDKLVKFKKRKLEPLLKSIPGLNYEDKFVYDGKSLDELSGSEIVSLAISILSLKEKGTLICINEAECLDDDTINSIKWSEDKDFILVRVAETPTKHKKFNHKEIKENGVQK